jgi:hypothetical protein
MHQFLSLRRFKNQKEATMREALKLKPLCTSYLFSAALLGAVLALIALLPTVANAKKRDKCPCAAIGRATKLNRIFMRQEFVGEPTTERCTDDGVETGVSRFDSEGTAESHAELGLVVYEDVTDEYPAVCSYGVVRSNGTIYESGIIDLQPGEVEACREDIRKLIAELDDCPTP